MLPDDDKTAWLSGLIETLPEPVRQRVAVLGAGALEAGVYARDILIEMAAWFRKNGWWFCALQVVGLLAAWWLVNPHDAAWLSELRNAFTDQRVIAMEWAGRISYWGDFLTFNLLPIMVFWFVGRSRHRRDWRRLALACLLASCLAGLTTNVVRFAAGRARPSARIPDGFYGPHVRPEYQAFPSAHTTTAFSMAVPALVAKPPLGLAFAAVAGAVSWSRMFRNQHQPTDILAGVWVAVLFGVPFGAAARRLRLRDKAAFAGVIDSAPGPEAPSNCCGQD